MAGSGVRAGMLVGVEVVAGSGNRVLVEVRAWVVVVVDNVAGAGVLVKVVQGFFAEVD